MKTELEILKEARDLISDPIRWTKGAVALSDKGRAVKPWSRRAVCWCAIGALTAKPHTHTKCKSAQRLLENFTPNQFIYEYNDTHTHAEVIAVFDKAIESLEAKKPKQENALIELTKTSEDLGGYEFN